MQKTNLPMKMKEKEVWKSRGLREDLTMFAGDSWRRGSKAGKCVHFWITDLGGGRSSDKCTSSVVYRGQLEGDLSARAFQTLNSLAFRDK